MDHIKADQKRETKLIRVVSLQIKAQLPWPGVQSEQLLRANHPSPPGFEIGKGTRTAEKMVV
jgi:hypothetical protein